MSSYIAALSYKNVSFRSFSKVFSKLSHLCNARKIRQVGMFLFRHLLCVFGLLKNKHSKHFGCTYYNFFDLFVCYIMLNENVIHNNVFSENAILND